MRPPDADAEPPDSLAPLRRADAAELLAANRDSREYHAPFAEPCVDQAGFDRLIGAMLTGPNLTLLARHGGTGGVAGVLTRSQIVWDPFRSAYLGFYGTRAQARRGLMSAGLPRCLAYAFEELGLHRLEANIQPDNAASKALVARLGFRREGFSPRHLAIAGVWADHERWARRADD